MMAKIFLVTSMLKRDLESGFSEDLKLPAAFTDEEQANLFVNFFNKKFDEELFVDSIEFNPENWEEFIF